MCPQDVLTKLREWEKDILTFWILFNAIASMAMSGVACQLAICFLHIQFSFPRRVPPNPPQRLIRKSRLAYDKLMAQTVYLDLVEIISKMTLFLDITGERQRRYFALIPLRAWCCVEHCAAAQKCPQLAGACTANAETTANRTLTAVSVLEGSEMSAVADLFWQNG